MIYLISGQPGNGKTLRAMFQIREEQERNAAANKLPPDHTKYEELRRFFTNINGATTEDNPKAFPWMEKLPEHRDWTKLPKGSFVCYDEAHSDGETPGLEIYGKLFPSTGKPGESNDPRIRAMSTHRHFGIDLLLITQWPNKIHHQARTLVGEHVHMTRAMGLQAAGVRKWNRVQVNPYDEAIQSTAEEEIWKYPKDLYGTYLSSVLHTEAYKFKVPRKVWGGLSMLVVGGLVAWALYFVVVPKSVRENRKAKTEVVEAGNGGANLFAPSPTALDIPSSLPLGTGDYELLNTQATPTLAGCVASSDRCRCFNTDGYQIDLSLQQCNDIISKPMPFNVYHPYTTGQGSTQSAEVVKLQDENNAVRGMPERHGDALSATPIPVLGAPVSGLH